MKDVPTGWHHSFRTDEPFAAIFRTCHFPTMFHPQILAERTARHAVARDTVHTTDVVFRCFDLCAMLMLSTNRPLQAGNERAYIVIPAVEDLVAYSRQTTITTSLLSYWEVLTKHHKRQFSEI